MIASYSASLLEAEKFSRMDYFMTYPIRALSCSPRLALVFHKAPSTFRVHQSKLSSSIPC